MPIEPTSYTVVNMFWQIWKAYNTWSLGEPNTPLLLVWDPKFTAVILKKYFQENLCEKRKHQVHIL